MAPSSALPIGASRVITELQPVAVDPASNGLLHVVLALLPSAAQLKKQEEDFTDEELVTADVVGFILV